MKPVRRVESTGPNESAACVDGACALREQQLRQVNERLRQSESRVEKTSARLGGIISSAMDAVISIDSQQRIVLVNPAAESMFGVSAKDLVGQNISRLIPERFRAAHVQHVADFGRTGVTTRRMGALGTISGLRADGEEFPIEAAISQVEVGGEKLFTVILRDITERKRAELALRQSQEQLQVVNRELNDFATMVSHDLKTPLRALGTLTMWLQSDYAGKLDGKGREHLMEMGKRVERMDRMIDDILDYSRLGRSPENVERVSLSDLLADIVEDIAPPPEVSVHIAPGMPLVCGEAVRLRQLFQNLIGNAIKHGNKSQMDIGVVWTDAGEFWQFSVADNGPGIEERHFDRIFKMFHTLVPKDKTGSTGVGLALVKRIVELAGGRVWVESRVGKGSTFYFTWPKVPPAAGIREVFPAAGGEHCTLSETP